MIDKSRLNLKKIKTPKNISPIFICFSKILKHFLPIHCWHWDVISIFLFLSNFKLFKVNIKKYFFFKVWHRFLSKKLNPNKTNKLCWKCKNDGTVLEWPLNKVMERRFENWNLKLLPSQIKILLFYFKVFSN